MYPLYGNALEDTPSTIYYDIDYSQGSILPVNYASIISGSANKASLQDYNYFSRRSIIPRYQGSRNGETTEYNITNAAIDTTQAYFAYFNYVGGTSPEWGNGLEDRSGINIRFLIDRDGNVIKPIADSQGINQGIIENNFTEGKIATLAFDDEAGAAAAFSNLLGDHTIFKSGKTIAPICYSQTESIASGSNGGYATSLTFVQGDQQQGGGSIQDYRLTSNVTEPLSIAATPSFVPYTTNTYEGAHADQYAPGPGIWGYKVITSSPSAVGVTLYLTATLKRAGAAQNTQLTVQFFKSTNNGVSFSAVGNDKTFDFSNTFIDNFSISYNDSTANANDIYALKVTGRTGLPINIDEDSYFQVTQQPQPNLGDATTPYFTKSGTTLTLSGLANFYGQKQEDIKNSGFFNITNDFTIQVGDEIRFDGTETQTYTVLEDLQTNPRSFRLDRTITASNLSWFLVRRYIDDPANIILEVDKTAGGTSPGILKPQYLSKDAEDNIDTILEKLKTDQLI